MLNAKVLYISIIGVLTAGLSGCGFPYIVDELYRLGHAYMEHGDEASARRTFTQLLEHYPDSSYKAEVKRLLEKQ